MKNLTLFPGWSLLIVLVSLLSTDAEAKKLNGFDVSNATIPVKDILSGGPPRDGIPSIDEPRFVAAGNVDYLKDDDIVIGLGNGDTARAYPLRILVWHEIVNDTIGDQPVAVTYCPLCGTSMVFDRRINGTVRRFGVSGLLYQSDVLMYDRESESLWSQLKMEAVSGPEAGKKLTWLPSRHLTWKAWRTAHPQGEVLSTKTGFSRNYDGQAYASYFATDRTMFPVPRTRTELPNKEWVIGVLINGKAKAYPVKRLPDGQPIDDEVGGSTLTLRWDAQSRQPHLQDATGQPVPYVMVFWFAWQAFYPETELWEAQ